jgi:hypothetical protein
MKKILTLFLAMLFLFTATGCNNVHYVAQQDGCKLTLDGLWWTYRMEIDRESKNEGCLYYKATLTEGEVNVYYDSGLLWDKELLFTLKAGETIENKGGYIEGEVDIIIEPLSPSSGSIEIFYSK